MGNQDQKGAVRWIKRGGGGLSLRDGREITAGEFTAHPDDIPQAFRDIVARADGMEPEEPLVPTSPPPVNTTYSIKTAGLPGKFNVVDGQGKVINEKGLTAAEAKTLLESLS